MTESWLPWLLALCAAAAAWAFRRRSQRLETDKARVARSLRDKEDQLRTSAARLEEFLVALESSPNGVVLLDENGRIEWCNLTAATHFGFDAERDRLQSIGNLVRDPAFAAPSP